MDSLPDVSAELCPRCQAPRNPGPECLHCGVIYARAKVRPGPVAPLVEPEWKPETEEEAQAFEGKLQRSALPVTLGLAFLAVGTGPGHALIRIFLSMWVHELGHAVTAWFCGFFAVPGPWRTLIAEERSMGCALFLLAALALLAREGWRRRHALLLTIAALGLLAQAVGTLGLKPHLAQALITFGGDGGCLLLGTLLMASFYVRAERLLRATGLRWGFLVIGAAAFADVSSLWWRARKDSDLIPFGEIEGVGLSDPSKLLETFRWTEEQVIHRYVALAGFCLAGLSALYLGSLWRNRRVTLASPSGERRSGQGLT